MKMMFKTDKKTAENIITLIQDDIDNINFMLGIDSEDIIYALCAIRESKIQQIEAIKQRLQ